MNKLYGKSTVDDIVTDCANFIAKRAESVVIVATYENKGEIELVIETKGNNYANVTALEIAAKCMRDGAGLN